MKPVGFYVLTSFALRSAFNEHSDTAASHLRAVPNIIVQYLQNIRCIVYFRCATCFVTSYCAIIVCRMEHGFTTPIQTESDTHNL
jgi:hypothetical protein